MIFEEKDEIANEIFAITQKIRRIKSKPFGLRSKRDFEELEVLQMELTHLRKIR